MRLFSRRANRGRSCSGSSDCQYQCVERRTKTRVHGTSSGDAARLKAVSSSYEAFTDISEPQIKRSLRPRGSVGEAQTFLRAASTRAGQPIDLVAIDMPLSLTPITARRVSDNLVSSAYGARHCATHTPSALRPGPVSDRMREEFGAGGYPQITAGPVVGGLIEVHPGFSQNGCCRPLERNSVRIGKRNQRRRKSLRSL